MDTRPAIIKSSGQDMKVHRRKSKLKRKATPYSEKTLIHDNVSHKDNSELHHS